MNAVTLGVGRVRRVRAGHEPRALGLLAAAMLLAVAVVASLRFGSLEIPAHQVVRAFTAFDGSDAHLVVRELRLPRTLIGLGVGAALALSGALLQAATRNPLGDAGVLGINAGAAFAIVTALHLGWLAPAGLVPVAFAGALGAGVLVYGVAAGGRGGATPVKLALAGVIVAALLRSWSTALLLLDDRTLDEARFWFAGSLAGHGLDALSGVVPWLAAGIVVALGLGGQLNVLSLGEDVARALGQRTGLVRAVAGLAAVVLAGSAAALAGPIIFVGLLVPHAVRAVVGGDYRWILPYCTLLGPVLLLVADVAGRLVVKPAELQAGIVTALVGAPLLVHLARRRAVAV